jgi:hypothetical protein
MTIIKAGTGTGKSFLAGRICSQAFNFQKKILMTLPKKILAIETAESTAITCDVRLGEEVGYYFKGEYNIDKNNKESKIIFTTTGSLIRKITGDDPYLSDYSCIVIDEAHERTVQTDELILFLKKALLVRKDLKIIFISATLNVDEFKKYYKDYSFNVVDMGDGTTKKMTLDVPSGILSNSGSIVTSGSLTVASGSTNTSNDCAMYFGTSGSVGSWRIAPSGANLVIQKWNGTAYSGGTTITP